MPSKFEWISKMLSFFGFFFFPHHFFLNFRNEILAKKVFFGLFIFASIFFPTVTAANKLRPTYDVLFSLWNEFYIPPWMRIIPYLIGTIGGYLQFQLKNKFNLTKVSEGLIECILRLFHPLN